MPVERSGRTPEGAGSARLERTVRGCTAAVPSCAVVRRRALTRRRGAESRRAAAISLGGRAGGRYRRLLTEPWSRVSDAGRSGRFRYDGALDGRRSPPGTRAMRDRSANPMRRGRVWLSAARFAAGRCGGGARFFACAASRRGPSSMRSCSASGLRQRTMSRAAARHRVSGGAGRGRPSGLRWRVQRSESRGTCVRKATSQR